MKFYRTKFIPITIYEEQDRNRTLKRFEYARVLGYSIAFLTANNINKIKSAVFQRNMMPTNFLSLFTKGFGYGLVGFFIAHCISLTILFSHTDYIRLRLYYEKSIQFDRKNVKDKYEDYPFAHKANYLYNDLEVRNKIKKKKPNNLNEFGEDSVMKKKNRRLLNFNNKNKNDNEQNEMELDDNLKRNQQKN